MAEPLALNCLVSQTLSVKQGTIAWSASIPLPIPRSHLLLKVSNFPHDGACVLNGLDELAAILETTRIQGLLAPVLALHSQFTRHMAPLTSCRAARYL